MLVLTRHVHQSIVIGHDVVVTVLEVRGDQVRLGITAPKDVQVHREEVFVALTAANRQAATSSTDLGVLSELVPGKQPPRPGDRDGHHGVTARAAPAAKLPPDRRAAPPRRPAPPGAHESARDASRGPGATRAQGAGEAGRGTEEAQEEAL